LRSLKALRKVFGRSTPAFTFVLIISFSTIVLSTVYHMVAMKPDEFLQMPKTQEYKNAVSEIMGMDPWTRTQHYWANNLRSACVSAAGTPFYIPLTTLLATGYYTGIAITYVSYVSGGGVGLAFLSQIFVHGILELTGVCLIAAGGLRLAWEFWCLLGGIAKNENLKRKSLVKRIKLPLADFLILFLVGAFLITLAAPVEAFISPSAGRAFVSQHLLALTYLAGVAVFYTKLASLGFRVMIQSVASTFARAKTAKFEPEHLSLLTLFLFLGLGIASFL